MSQGVSFHSKPADPSHTPAYRFVKELLVICGDTAQDDSTAHALARGGAFRVMTATGANDTLPQTERRDQQVNAIIIDTPLATYPLSLDGEL